MEGFDAEFWRRTGLNSRIVDEGGWTSKAKVVVEDRGIDEWDEYYCYYHCIGSFARSKEFPAVNPAEFNQDVRSYWDIPVKLESFWVDLSSFRSVFDKVDIKYFQTRIFSGGATWLGGHVFYNIGNFLNKGMFPEPTPIEREFRKMDIDDNDDIYSAFTHENIGYFYTYWGFGGILKFKKNLISLEDWQAIMASIPEELVANWQGKIYHV